MQLPDRWYPLRDISKQLAYRDSPYRFNVVAAGRRSGKTERAKRKLILALHTPTQHFPARFFAAAPTRDQAMRIWWDDLKMLMPKETTARIYESGVIVSRIKSELHVIGMDKPQRIEGPGWDGGVLDEYANMKPEAWGNHVRPALADRNGWCDLIGVPEGRNHFYDIFEYGKNSGDPEFCSHHWPSSDVLTPSEIEAAKRQSDQLTYQQEYEASFVNFAGQAYYAFREDTHCARLEYDPAQPVIFCFDFNVSPGVAAVVQEQPLPNGNIGTAVVGEIFIPKHSNTILVCEQIAERYAKHEGRVYAYGDATGGARSTRGDRSGSTDWDIIRRELSRPRPEYGKPDWGDRLIMANERHNPTERSRVNAVNTRLMTTDGQIRMMVDPAKAPQCKNDFEGVRLIEGTGAIDKISDPKLTHLTDAIGYYIAKEYPIQPHTSEISSLNV